MIYAQDGKIYIESLPEVRRPVELSQWDATMALHYSNVILLRGDLIFLEGSTLIFIIPRGGKIVFDSRNTTVYLDNHRVYQKPNGLFNTELTEAFKKAKEKR